MTCQSFTKKLLSDPTRVHFKICGKAKKIKAFARLTSKNYLDSEYWKIRFTDDSFLLIILQDEEIYYSDQYKIHIKYIKDNQISKDN